VHEKVKEATKNSTLSALYIWKAKSATGIAVQIVMSNFNAFKLKNL